MLGYFGEKGAKTSVSFSSNRVSLMGRSFSLSSLSHSELSDANDHLMMRKKHNTNHERLFTYTTTLTVQNGPLSYFQNNRSPPLSLMDSLVDDLMILILLFGIFSFQEAHQSAQVNQGETDLYLVRNLLT